MVVLSAEAWWTVGATSAAGFTVPIDGVGHAVDTTRAVAGSGRARSADHSRTGLRIDTGYRRAIGRPCDSGVMPNHHTRAPVLLVVTLLVLTACGPTSTDAQAAGEAPPPATSSEQASDDSATASDAPTTGTTQTSAADVTLEPVVDLDAPTVMATRAGDDAALYIGERGGRVVRVVDGAVDDTPVLDISADTTTDGERGLLGIDFSDDGRSLYVSYTDRNGNSRLDAYRMDGASANPSTRRNLLEVAQPYANHNGGNVVTGPDGLLYFGLGDGGAAGDPQGNGQDTSTLLGAMLRIDPDDGDAPYSVPADNPFGGGGDARPEIWIYGLRNPWRFSFDRETDDLWIGDVGQGAVEEIDRLPFADAGGSNMGWRVFEGTRRYSDGRAPEAVPPVHEYSHDGRCSVTGGYVYRGSQVAGLDGTYVYGDYCDGVIRALMLDGGRVTGQREFDVQVPALVSFGEDATGELYALSLEGTVFRLVAAG